MLFYSIALLITVLDQICKYTINKYMVLGQSLPLLGNFFKLTYVRNTGAAFSFFVGFSPYLAVIGLAVSIAVVYFHYRIPSKNYFLQIALAFILGGSLGNLSDRIFRSYVIDYLDFTVWPVFNLADIMINVGVFMLVYKLFEKEGKNVSGSI
jgi:signal peptidase II